MTASEITAEIERTERRMDEVEHEGFDWRTLDNRMMELERALYRAQQTVNCTDWL